MLSTLPCGVFLCLIVWYGVNIGVLQAPEIATENEAVS